MKELKILVVGSLVMDLIVTTSKFPERGETILGNDFKTASGGKGANQAVQASLIGADVTMVGKVGKDFYGETMIDSLKKSGVNVENIFIDETTPSSIGNVQLEINETNKDNRIIVVPGANYKLSVDDILFLKEEIANFAFVIIQLEIPLEINKKIAQFAFEKNIPLMLNSAPSMELDDDFLSKLTYISPNEYEMFDLTKINIRDKHEKINIENLKLSIKILLDKGVKNVIVTLGEDGAAFSNKEEFFIVPAIKNVEVKDPTAAGDSFVSAFCTAKGLGVNNKSSLEFANYVGALTVSKFGAQPSLSTLEEIKTYMKSQNYNNSEIDNYIFETSKELKR